MAALLGSSSRSFAAPAIGATLPPCTTGGLDIHHINTGEGSAAFLILPDETTLLIDCGYGQAARAPKYKAPRRPDESRLPGEWIARYVQRVHPRGRNAPVNHAVVSHIHGDHMGGFAEFFRHARIEVLLDRGWPDYVGASGPIVTLYRAALQQQMERHQLKVERYKAGVNNQVRLRYAPERHRDFEVRHIAVNGEVWTGSAEEVRRRLLIAEGNDENPQSAVLRLRHRAFDYYSGGDLLGPTAERDTPAWRDMESAVAWVTGPVDVAVLNHHGNSDGSSPFFLSESGAGTSMDVPGVGSGGRLGAMGSPERSVPAPTPA